MLGIANHRQYPEFEWRPFGSPRTNPTRFALGLDALNCNTAQSLMGGGGPAVGFGGLGNDYCTAPRKSQRSPTQYRDAAFTPNFPAYPSGHATFGGACFQMLKLVRHERPQTHEMPDRIEGSFVSDELNGISIDHFRNEPRPFIPIAYSSIDRMIEDNDSSRVYLGVHWRFDCNRGSDSGRRIARAVYGSAYEPLRPEGDGR